MKVSAEMFSGDASSEVAVAFLLVSSQNKKQQLEAIAVEFFVFLPSMIQAPIPL